MCYIVEKAQWWVQIGECPIYESPMTGTPTLLLEVVNVQKLSSAKLPEIDGIPAEMVEALGSWHPVAVDCYNRLYVYVYRRAQWLENSGVYCAFQIWRPYAMPNYRTIVLLSYTSKIQQLEEHVEGKRNKSASTDGTVIAVDASFHHVHWLFQSIWFNVS